MDEFLSLTNIQGKTHQFDLQEKQSYLNRQTMVMWIHILLQSSSSTLRHRAFNAARRRGLDNGKPLEVTKEVCVVPVDLRRAAERVGLAAAAKRGRARSGVVRRRPEKLALVPAVQRRFDALEHISLEDAASSCLTALDQMPGVVVENVVDGVQQGAAAERRAAAGRHVDVVLEPGDGLGARHHLLAPVRVLVAGRGIGRLAVDEAVGDGEALVGILPEGVVLAPRQGGLDMVDPNVGAARDADSIATPHILGVEVGDLEVLDDDIGDGGQAETLACESSQVR